MIAGCFGQPATAPEPGVLETPFLDPTITIHDGLGTRLPRGAYDGELPAMVGRLLRDDLGGHGSFEPSIGVGPDGTAYYVSGDVPLTRTVYRTHNQGETWQDVTPKPESGVSGDPFLHTDPETGRVFMYDQQTYLVCNHWSVSDDGGESWRARNTCGEQGSYGDHPSIATGRPRVVQTHDYPNVVYFCASIGGETSCRTSLDGGFTYGPPVRAMEACEDTSRGPDPGQSGHVETSVDGRVYISKVACGGVRLGMSDDDGQTWRTAVVNKSGWTHQKWPELNEHEASVAVDSAGTIYIVVLADDGTTTMVVSRDDATTWSSPVRVSAPNVTATNFAYIAAGEPGRIAVMYAGTSVPGGFNATPSEMAKAEWHAYAAFSLNADSERPVFATALVNAETDPVRRGPCWARCPVREGPLGRGVLQDAMGDFLDIDLDPSTGRLWLALVDLCHDACARDKQSGPDDGAYARAYVGVQVGGTTILRPR